MVAVLVPVVALVPVPAPVQASAPVAEQAPALVPGPAVVESGLARAVVAAALNLAVAQAPCSVPRLAWSSCR